MSVVTISDRTTLMDSFYLEIMQHVLDWTLSEKEQHWISRNDDEFKFHLDRYKYPNRYEDVDEI